MNNQILLQAVRALEAERNEKVLITIWVLFLLFVLLGCVDLYYRSKKGV